MEMKICPFKPGPNVCSPECGLLIKDGQAGETCALKWIGLAARKYCKKPPG